jgi:acetyltransferase-like isoleucine patch superfamily enzyme/acyl carrier protein
MQFDLHALVRGASKTWARAMNARAIRRVDRVGAGVLFSGAPHFENFGSIEIGDDSVISSRPVLSHFVTGPGAILRIGSRVTIGSGAAITAHARVEIEDDARLGDGVVIMDTDFHATKDHGAAPSAEPVLIGAGARVGDRVTVLKGARIGRGARIFADSVVGGEIPDGVTAQGVPARVLDGPDWSSAETAAGEQDAEAVRERVVAIVAATFRGAKVSLDDGPSAIHGWDSLGSLRLLVAIEDAFGIILPEAMLTRARTVRALADEIVAQFERAP